MRVIAVALEEVVASAASEVAIEWNGVSWRCCSLNTWWELKFNWLFSRFNCKSQKVHFLSTLITLSCKELAAEIVVSSFTFCAIILEDNLSKVNGEENEEDDTFVLLLLLGVFKMDEVTLISKVCETLVIIDVLNIFGSWIDLLSFKLTDWLIISSQSIDFINKSKYITNIHR